MKRLSKIIGVFLILCLSPAFAHAQAKEVTYKTIQRKGKEYKLKLHLFNPENHEETNQTPCIVIFHSGGWSSGSPQKYFGSCKFWSAKGMVAIAVEYSIRKVHQGTPFDSVADAKSAIRWVRSHARELGINPDMIAAGGGSAGAHVSAAAAHLSEFDEETEDHKISSKPNALVLRSPVFDNGPGGYGYSKVKERWKEFSPVHNVSKGNPPTIVFIGSDEAKYIRVDMAQNYEKEMKKAGNRCELIVYTGETHGCPGKRQEIKEKSAHFLKSLGYFK